MSDGSTRNTFGSETCFHILLVEDNPGDVGLIRRALAHREPRTELHVASDGIEALDFLHQCGHGGAPPPHLILVDLNLPKMDGCELLKHIKQNTTLMSIPVIVLSSSQAEADVLRSYAHHANCYITKPLDLEEYLAVIGAVHHFWLMVAHLPRSKTHA
jgi:two-component system response regulator